MMRPGACGAAFGPDGRTRPHRQCGSYRPAMGRRQRQGAATAAARRGGAGGGIQPGRPATSSRHRLPGQGRPPVGGRFPTPAHGCGPGASSRLGSGAHRSGLYGRWQAVQLVAPKNARSSRKAPDARGGDWLHPIDPREWHLFRAAEAEADKAWFAARFHLTWLLKDDTNNADLLRRRDEAEAHLKAP